MSEPDLAKLSQAAKLSSIRTDILKLVVAHGLPSPQVVRNQSGHVYLPSGTPVSKPHAPAACGRETRAPAQVVPEPASTAPRT